MPARILIVEDNADNLKLMGYLLRAFGHTPVVAGDGEEALEIVCREPFDLIVCDVHLPKIDGCEVARRLKKHPALHAIPLVAVTALAMVGDRDKVLAAGFDGYISKPIAPQTFVQQVESFLRPGTVQHSASPPSVPKDLHSPSFPPMPTCMESTVASGPSQTVLVVDDSPVNIKLACEILKPAGYRVVTTDGVQNGLALARQILPDLILSDVHMGKESGHDFIRAVKADPELNRIPFVFISSTVWQQKDETYGLALGASKFLMRPLKPQTFLAEIEACLASRKER